MPYCWLKHHHQSKSETVSCNDLFVRQKAGQIRGFELWPSLKLHVAGKLWRVWKADFKVFENDGTYSIHESKGWNRSNDDFKLKASHFLLEYPQIPLFVNGKRIYPGELKFKIQGVGTRAKRKSKFHKSWNRKTQRWDTVPNG